MAWGHRIARWRSQPSAAVVDEHIIRRDGPADDMKRSSSGAKTKIGTGRRGGGRADKDKRKAVADVGAADVGLRTFRTLPTFRLHVLARVSERFFEQYY